MARTSSIYDNFDLYLTIWLANRLTLYMEGLRGMLKCISKYALHLAHCDTYFHMNNGA